mgnify:CR=1 FL=1
MASLHRASKERARSSCPWTRSSQLRSFQRRACRAHKKCRLLAIVSVE